ncbi:TauD/TfdA family dioxygenase [Streptomyces sp. 796.1]|uniref:TauD/TfdA family dioxygenase n=1 Tax=Streptomyces sp. 796.1 TaxID=3163029 RepID=UPI0039C984AE
MVDLQPHTLARLDAAADAPDDAAAWVAAHRSDIDALVAQHGAVLVRGLPLADRGSAVAAVREVIGTGLVEREGFAPREQYAPGVYSSSQWPADQPMCMHHELSYAAEAPRVLAFACCTPPRRGGVTGLADARAVLADLPAELVARFEREGWLLQRHYNPFVGLSWQDAFGVAERAQVEEYCAARGITTRWSEDGGLHTTQRCPAVVHHPESGERCWFNQIAFLNGWTLAPDVREFLISEFGPDALPFDTRYGDGTALEPATVDLINEVYERHTVREPWQRGDLLVVDNVRVAHSREPYRGEREIIVGLGGSFAQ